MPWYIVTAYSRAYSFDRHVDDGAVLSATIFMTDASGKRYLTLSFLNDYLVVKTENRINAAVFGATAMQESHIPYLLVGLKPAIE